MAHPLTLILVSDRADDRDFAMKVGRQLDAKVETALTSQRMIDLLHSHQNCSILMDLNSMIEAAGEVESELASGIPQVLTSLRAWHRVIGISSYEFAVVLGLGKFSNHTKYLHRNYTPDTIPVYTYLIQQNSAPNPFEVRPFGVDDLQIQRTRIDSAARKKTTLEALAVILDRKTLPRRTSAAIIRATDELILNAIFDAPLDMNGRRYRHEMDRGSDYALNQLSKREEVEIELISAPNFLQISVSDSFGSLKREDLVPLLERNFLAGVVEPDQDSTSAPGLGFYLTVTTGLSVQICIEPGKRTRVSLLVPWVENVRSMRDSFRFFCIRIR